jgi:hypothetical protein
MSKVSERNLRLRSARGKVRVVHHEVEYGHNGEPKSAHLELDITAVEWAKLAERDGFEAFARELAGELAYVTKQLGLFFPDGNFAQRRGGPK